jgi:Tfp pilus assembly protein PilF
MNENAEYLWIDISGLTREPPEDHGQYAHSDILFSWNADADANEYSDYTISYQLDIASGSALVSNIIASYTNISNGSFTYSENLEEGQIYFARIAISLNGGKTYQNMSAFSDGIVFDTQPPDVYTPTAQSGSQENEVIFTFNGQDAHTISSYHIQIDTDPSFSNPIVDTSQNTLSESTEITYAYMATSGQNLYARAFAIDGANNQSLYSALSEPFLMPLITDIQPYTSTTVGQTTVVINGSNFGLTQGVVLFATSEVTQINSWSMDSIVVKSPPRNPGLVDITVLTENGQKETLKDAHEYFPMLNWSISTQVIEESTNNVVITAILDQLTSKNVIFSYTLSGTATSADYSLNLGQMTISAGSASVSKTFQLKDDKSTESDETLVIKIISPINAIAGNMISHTITIRDNDAVIDVNPESTTVSSESGMITFNISNTGSGDLIWNAISNASWLTIIQGMTGTNDGIIVAQYNSNEGNSRTGNITVMSDQAVNSPKIISIDQTSKIVQKPSISSISDMTIDEDQPAGPFTFTVSDMAYSSSVLSVSASSSNISLLANENIMLSGVTDSRNITLHPKPNKFGTSTIQLIVTNPDGLTAGTSFMLTVTQVNDPPSISLIPGQTINEDAAFDDIPLNLYVSDVDDTEFTWSTSGQNNLSVIIDVNDIASITINNENWFGTESILFTVADSGGLTDHQTVGFKVNPVNDAPIISNIPDQNIQEGESFTPISLDAFIEDVDNQNSEIIWMTSGSQDLEVTINNRIAIISAPNENWYGTETITFAASDTGGLTASDSAVFSISPVNDPPTISVIQNQTIDEDTVFADIPLSLYVSDVDGTEFNWLTSGQNNLSVMIDVNDIARITINNENWFGSESILFTVADPGGLTDSRMVDFIVKSVNDAPIITDIPDQNIQENELFVNISLDDYIDDVDNNDSDLSWMISGSQHIAVTINNRIATITALDGNWHGTETIVFTASDPGGLTASDSAVYTITPINDPPKISSIPGQTINEDAEFSNIPLNLYVSDVDDTDFTWSTSGQNNLSVSIDVNDIASITINNENWFGSESILFTVADSGGLTDHQTVGFKVNPVNDAPIISNIPDQNIQEGASFTPISLDAFIEDVDNQDSEISWMTSGSQHLEVTINNRIAIISAPNENWYGTETITFLASDPGDLTASDTAVFSISPVNDPPEISSIPGQTIDEDSAFTDISLNLYVSDVDDTEFTWSTSGQNNLSVSIDVNDIASITINNENWFGTESIFFTVADSGGLTASRRVDFIVTPVNDAPIISNIESQVITEGTMSHAVQLTVNDIESTALLVSVSSSNQNLIPNNRLLIDGNGLNRTLTLSPMANQTGHSTIQLTVSDSEGLTAQTEFLFVINESSNILPETPTIVSDMSHISKTSGTVIFRANPFNDPDENEHPLQTLIRIGRVDRLSEYVIEETNSYDSLLNNGYQEYSLNIDPLESGLKYYWQIAFIHTGGQTEWSLPHKFLVGDIVTVHHPDIPIGDTQEQFEMISFAHFFLNPAGSAVLQNTIGSDYDTTNYRIGIYDPTYKSGAYLEYDHDLFIIEPGRAYWCLSRNPVDLNTSGIPVSKKSDIDIPLLYNTTNKNGWNMIACPNDADYYWGDLQVLYYENDHLVAGPISVFDAQNQFMETRIWEWHDGEYSSSTDSGLLLKRQKGYWVYSLSSGVYLRFPHNKAILKRRIQITAIDWIQKNSLIQNAHAGNAHTPPPPMNAFGRIQVDSETPNCFIEIIDAQVTDWIPLLMFSLIFLVACHRHVKWVGVIFMTLISLSNALASDSSLTIEAGRSFFDMGVFAYEDGMYEAAKENFTKALSKNPDNPFYLQYAGKTNLKLKKYVDAQKLLDRAWSINPNIHGLKFDRAYIYFQIKEYHKASPLFVEIADDSPEDVLSVYLAGVSYFKNKQYVLAVKYLIQAAERSPNIKPNAFFYAGVARIKAGQIKNGLKLLKYVQANGNEQIKKMASQWISVIKKMEKSQKPFTAKLSLGYKYDTNVQIEPDDMNIYSDEKDYAVIFKTHISYKTPLNDQWHLRMGHHHFMVKYQSLDEYDLMHISPYLSTQYRRYPFTLTFYYKPSTDYVNNASYLTRHRFNPIIKQKIRNKLDMILSYEYTKEDYDEIPEKNGHRNNLKMTLKYPINKKMALSSSLTYQDKSASHAASDYHLVQGEINLSLISLMDLKIDLTGKYDRKNYDYSDPVYEAKRIDKRLNSGLSLTKKINSNVSVYLGLTYMKNDSNVNMFNYHQQVSLISINANF